MIQAIRTMQSRIEDKLIAFYQNLPEREQLKVIFTLPQLKNHSFIEALNRSANVSNNASISQELASKLSFEQNGPSVPNSPKAKFYTPFDFFS